MSKFDWRDNELSEQQGCDWTMTNESDINVKCTAKKCPYAKNCFRKSARSTSNQMWYNFQYKCNEDSGFESYICNDTNKD